MSELNFEENILYRIQQKTKQFPGLNSLARGMSLFGEHALGWIGLSGLGMWLDKRRFSKWRNLGLAAVIAHGLSIVIKRIIRRPRPDNVKINIGVKTPSKLSFPSSHASSTAAAAVILADVLGIKSWKTILLLLSPMMFSRMLLGVHYPSDVAAGAVLGALTAEAVKKIG